MSKFEWIQWCSAKVDGCIAKKNSKKQGKVAEVTGIDPKDDYTSNGAMARKQKGRGWGDSDTWFCKG